MKVEHIEKQKEIFRNKEEYGKRGKPPTDYIAQFCFDPECLFLLINPNYRTILHYYLHYYLHGVIKFFLILKENVEYCLLSVKKLIQILAQIHCERNQSCSLSSATLDC